MRKIKTRIKEVRTTLGLNQTEFGARIGVKQTTIAGYENGARVPLDTVISSICREFKVNEVWLRTGVGEPFQQTTRKEAIASFMGEVLVSEPNDIRLRVVDILSRLTTEDWEFIEKRLLKLVEETKEEEGK